jgi:hypothetical protein
LDVYGALRQQDRLKRDLFFLRLRHRDIDPARNPPDIGALQAPSIEAF